MGEGWPKAGVRWGRCSSFNRPVSSMKEHGATEGVHIGTAAGSAGVDGELVSVAERSVPLPSPCGAEPVDTLQLENLGRRYGRRWALRGVDLSVREGEIIGVWGAGGSGKTTLLHLLATLLRPSEGRATLDTVDLATRASRARALLSLGFQTPTLDPDFSLYDGLELRALMHAVPGVQRANRIIQTLHLVGLEDQANVPVARLSHSQRRRAEVAAALLPTPRLLLLDDPFAGMEDETARRVWEYLLSLRTQERVTMLISVSRAEMAERCHRIAVLHRGRLMACDTPDLIRSAAGKDMVTVQPLDERISARRLHERLHVTVTEEDHGFRMEVNQGDAVAADLIGAFGAQTRAVYVRRPTLQAGLLRIAEGRTIADPTEDALPEAESPL